MEVRFWRRTNPQPHSGVTVDISKSGIFLGTSVQLDPGERIRLEFTDKERGFMVEGQVARVHRVSLALRHLEQPGVGVRFLSPAELMQEMTGKGKIQRSVSDSSGSMPIRTEPIDAGADAAAPPASRVPGGNGAAPPIAARNIVVEFVDRATFLNVYHRDIASGGLFVTTAEPARLHEVVSIELRPPVTTANPLRFEARVVHSADGPATGTGAPRGMGVQFLDPDRVRTTLAPIVLELRR